MMVLLPPSPSSCNKALVQVFGDRKWTETKQTTVPSIVNGFRQWCVWVVERKQGWWGVAGLVTPSVGQEKAPLMLVTWANMKGPRAGRAWQWLGCDDGRNHWQKGQSLTALVCKGLCSPVLGCTLDALGIYRFYGHTLSLLFATAPHYVETFPCLFEV